MKKIILVNIFCFLLLFESSSVFAQTLYEIDYILPESNSVVYSYDDIATMTAQELSYARNEIFARYGYQFQSEELQSYFNLKTWYEGLYSASDFQDSWLSDIEKENIELLKQREYELCPGGYVLDQAGYGTTWQVEFSQDIQQIGRIQLLSGMDSPLTMDLDSDGEEEVIDVTTYSGNDGCSWSYCIQNGKYEAAGTAENLVQNIYGVNLDGIHTLLVIYELGPSDDPICTFYQWDTDQGFTCLGAIHDSVDSICVNEDGSMSVSVRRNVFQTDFIGVTYALDANGMLAEVQQDIYEFTFPQDREYTLKQPLTVYETMDTGSAQIIILPQTVSFSKTDGDHWIYIQAADGTRGWFDCSDYKGDYQKSTDLFDNLFYAD